MRLLGSTLIPRILKKAVISLGQGIPWKVVDHETHERRVMMWDIFSRWSLPNVYAQIKVPSILIWGTRDCLFPISSAREVAKELPQGTLHILRGGHSILYTKANQVVDIIARELSTKSTSRTAI